ncbi:MAG: AMP-binding protein [Pseudomonadota bacterium]
MSPALARLTSDALAAYPFLIESTEGAALTPGAILDRARALAAALGAAGLGRDEPVLVRVANRPEDLVAFLGVWQAGAVAVPLHANAAPATVEAVTTQSGARFLVDGGALSTIAMAPPPERPLLRGAALIVFTSGSTGRPKGVVLGHDAFAGKIGVLARRVGIGPGDTVLLPLQLIFIFGLWVLLVALARAARIVLMGKFSAETVLELMPRTTVLGCVPSMLRTVFAHPPQSGDRLRMVLTGGEGLDRALTETLSARHPGAGVYDLYGLTETGAADFCLGPADAAGTGTIGRPTENVIARLGPAEQAVDADSGELLIRSPYGMLGYLDNPELTQASFTDGFFRTGDLARMRADGYVEIVGRIKEIISRGGNKIAPAEIDLVLSHHPAVAAALCAGVPDPRLGESVHAAVVLKPGAHTDAAELKAWAASRLERFKVPEAIHIVPALPQGPTGKALRSGVAALARATIAGDRT